jgi:hypothetical protein
LLPCASTIRRAATVIIIAAVKGEAQSNIKGRGARASFMAHPLYIHYIHYMVGKPEGKRPLGRPRRRWVDNIKLDLREIGWDGMDWIDLAQDRDQWRALVNTVTNFRVL